MDPLPSPDNDKCGICNLIVNDYDKAIKCNRCDKWIHILCNKITNRQYKQYQSNPDQIFECKNCNVWCMRENCRK